MIHTTLPDPPIEIGAKLNESFPSNLPNHCRIVSLFRCYASDVRRGDLSEELGNKYLYCGILTNTINGGASQRGNFMLAISAQLLGNKKIEDLRPNITAAKEMVAADMKASDAGFEKYSACIKMDNEQGKALFEKYKDALTKNAAR